MVGTNALPSFIALVLPDGTSRYDNTLDFGRSVKLSLKSGCFPGTMRVRFGRDGLAPGLSLEHEEDASLQ
jgi:hypothetical protein